jgi:adenylate cyclase
LEHLAELGVSVEEMQQADRAGTLVSAGVERLLSGGRWMTIAEVADRTGLDVDIVDRVQRAIGLSPTMEAIYDERSVAAFAAAAEFFGMEQTLQFSRVVGSAVTRIIDAATSLFANEVVANLERSGASELEIARSSEDATRLLLTLPETVEAIFPAYVRDAVRRMRLTQQQPSGGVRVAVGFVDLVGSTALANRLSGPELARAVGEFEAAAYDLALTHDSRVVKFIGDEAMVVSPDPAAVCAIELELCAVAANHPVLTGARAALDVGETIAQDGDYYGPVVNAAARLTSVAGPGQVLGTLDVQRALVATGGYGFASAGTHQLRGFDRPLDAVSITRNS